MILSGLLVLLAATSLPESSPADSTVRRVDSERWSQVATLVEGAVRRRLFPGAVVVVGRTDTVLWSHGFGRTAWSPKAPRPTVDETLWDLASLTKVVATTGAVMSLVDRGRLDLNRAVSSYLPRFVGLGKERVTVRMLLDHTSGLPAYRPLYREARTRDQAIELLYQVPLKREPGSRAEYSDLNAILLGLVVEQLTDESLAQAATSSVFEPLGMARTLFVPQVADRSRVAPSIMVDGRAQAGVVNDRNAQVLGGVAGHAGLFATGSDLARYARAWLRALRQDDRQWIRPETARRFLELKPVSGTRALGWDTADLGHLDRSAFGTSATGSTYGHTGWTGTFLWFDSTRDLFLVLLTNRSLGSGSGRSFRAMRELRAQVSDAVSRAAQCQGACRF